MGEPKVGPPCHETIDSGAVVSVGDSNVHKSPNRSRWPLAAVWNTDNSD